MDTIQPPQIPVTTPESQETQSVANQPKHTDTRVALTVTESRLKRGRRMRLTGRISPSIWADAMRRFCAGDLASYEAVAAAYGVSIQAVNLQAQKHGWQGARALHVQRVMDQCRQGTIMQGRGEEEAEKLRSTQDQIAAALLAFAQTMQAQAAQSLTATGLLTERLASMGSNADSRDMTQRLASVSAVHLNLVESLRVLAGIPHPDKGPGRYRSEPKNQPEEPSNPVTDISKVGVALSSEDAPQLR
jgi:hypothetical protein